MREKLLFLTTAVIVYLSSTGIAYGQNKSTATPTPGVSPTTEQSRTEALTDQIEDLKERIASRVAQLRLVEKRGIVGTVTEVTRRQITLTDVHGNKRFVDVDEITKFSGLSSKESFGISDIEGGTKISVIGLYNKQSRRILARYVNAYVLPVFLTGTITEIDEDGGAIRVLSENGKQTDVDIENVTRTNAYTKEDGVERSGFSQLEIDNRVVIVGYPDKANPARIVASRILVLPEAPTNPRLQLSDPALEEGNVQTSTDSGKNLTPDR